MFELPDGQSPACAGESTGLGDAVGGAVFVVDEVIGDGVVVDGAGCGGDVFAGVPAMSAGSGCCRPA